MSVRVKTLAIIGLTLFGLVVALYGAARFIVLTSFEQVEAQDTRQNVQRALNALTDELSTLSRTARDYAEWDDTYFFATDHDPTYLENNFTDSTFGNNRLSFAAIFDTALTELYTQGFDLNTGDYADGPSFFRALPKSDVLWQMASDDPESGARGLVMLPTGPLLLATRPILKSDSSGPLNGTLVMGRLLDDAQIAQLAEATRLKLSVWRLTEPLPADVEVVRPQLTGPEILISRPLDANNVAGYAILHDLYDQPILILRVELPRAIYLQGVDSLNVFLASLMVAGVIISLALSALLEVIVLRRLAQLSAEVTSIGDSQDFKKRVTQLGLDELGKLSHSINTMLAALEKLNRQLEIEQAKSQNLLLNVLPETIVRRLKQGEEHIADRYVEGTVLFADIVDFTAISSRISPDDVLYLLNEVFSAFDDLADKYQLEKIKTIGDAYMVVGGIPIRRADHAEVVADMALEMMNVLTQLERASALHLRLRIGINTGPVVAGVVGTRKFLYDLWGDTVNTASRMESHGVAGGIQVTTATYEKLRDKYDFKERGMVLVKGKGEMVTYLLLGRKETP